MSPRLRKFALAAHVTFSVGWIGAVAAFVILSVAGLASPSAQVVRAAYLAMEPITWFVIIPWPLHRCLRELSRPWAPGGDCFGTTGL